MCYNQPERRELIKHRILILVSQSTIKDKKFGTGNEAYGFLIQHPQRLLQEVG